MANAVITGTATTTAAATGNSGQGHILWAIAQAAWWIIYDGPATYQISAKYSANGTSWTAPAGSPMSIEDHTEADARNLGYAYKEIGGIDVVQSANGDAGGNFGWLRHTLGTTWTTSNASPGVGAGQPNGCVACFDSADYPWWAYVTAYPGGQINSYTSPGADSGSAWTPGTLVQANPLSPANQPEWLYLANLATARDLILLAANGSGTGVHTNVVWSAWNGTTWSATANAFTAFTSTADVNIGACQVSTSDTHCVVLSSGGNTFTHKRFNGTSWAAGNAVPTLTLAANSGIACVSNGTYVWAWAIDSSGNISYCQWSGSSWGSWTVQEATRANTPAYITAAINSAGTAIQVAWTETNGANYEIWTSNLGLAAGSTAALFAPATLSLGSGGAFFQTSVNG